MSETMFPELFAEARRTGKWFHANYQDLWFSPDQLEAEQRAGKFRWGAVNWTLRDPAERVAAAERRAVEAAHEYERIRRAVSAKP